MAGLAVANESVIVMFGDHGPDSTAQLFIDGQSWTDDQLRERFGVMFAGYGPGCDFDRHREPGQRFPSHHLLSWR